MGDLWQVHGVHWNLKLGDEKPSGFIAVPCSVFKSSFDFCGLGMLGLRLIRASALLAG